ncbi:hypothetical protein GTQ43_32240 [Nostoc sp. KVJ3]|uniref:hypothetical protein n=1 Tax=Nostoc sp. KVJ3 TaxID=457945 RepID=UPI002237939A|nr:hypothetical protein [Nostoc sp. KVJ3]MCW5318238.1 hypothetical protein [Nostoc sp. KVJ3]
MQGGNNYFVLAGCQRRSHFNSRCPPEGMLILEMGDFAVLKVVVWQALGFWSSQQVKGGYGILAAVNGGKEPTGRLLW